MVLVTSQGDVFCTRLVIRPFRMEQGYCQQMKQDVEVAITTGTVEESPLSSSLLHARPSYVGMVKVRQGCPSRQLLLTDT